MSKHQHFHVPVQLTAISLVVFAVHLARSILPEPAHSAYPRVRALACLVRAANAGQGHGLEWLRQSQSATPWRAQPRSCRQVAPKKTALQRLRGFPRPAVVPSPCLRFPKILLLVSSTASSFRRKRARESTHGSSSWLHAPRGF